MLRLSKNKLEWESYSVIPLFRVPRCKRLHLNAVELFVKAWQTLGEDWEQRITVNTGRRITNCLGEVVRQSVVGQVRRSKCRRCWRRRCRRCWSGRHLKPSCRCCCRWRFKVENFFLDFIERLLFYVFPTAADLAVLAGPAEGEVHFVGLTLGQLNAVAAIDRNELGNFLPFKL